MKSTNCWESRVSGATTYGGRARGSSWYQFTDNGYPTEFQVSSYLSALATLLCTDRLTQSSSQRHLRQLRFHPPLLSAPGTSHTDISSRVHRVHVLHFPSSVVATFLFVPAGILVTPQYLSSGAHWVVFGIREDLYGNCPVTLTDQGGK